VGYNIMRKINHEQLSRLIQIHYNTTDSRGKKICLLVYGTYGIGKSETTMNEAQTLAEQRGKIFVVWNEISEEKKFEVYNDIEKYFIYMDIRLSEFDASDIKGLPTESTDERFKEWLKWKVSFFAKVLEKPKCDGILLFDEINLATPLVISSCYKILYDRIINDGKIADDVLIMGCGNLETDNAYTHNLATPVRDRGCEVELLAPTGEKWIDNYAIPKGVEQEIIAYILAQPSHLQPNNIDINEQKPTTARGWARLDALIKHLKSTGKLNHAELDLISTSAIGEGIGRTFTAFWKVSQAIKIDDIIKNPSLLETIKEVDLKYFVVSSLSEKFGNKKLTFDKVIEVSEVLDKIGSAEFVALLWRLAFKYNPKAFKDGFLKDKSDIKLRFQKYLGEII